MSINTRLVLLLTVTVGAVMFLASFLSLKQREATLEAALRDELRAHAVTLSIALEEKYQNGRAGDARRLADRLRDNSKIYAVLVFDSAGEIISISQPATNESLLHPPELQAVLQTGEAAEFVRRTEEQKFASVILPLRLEGEKRGAIELVKPLSLVEDDIFRARLNWLSTTLLLLAVIFLVVYIVARRNISRPIGELLDGAEALGTGDFEYRVRVPKSKDELASLAAEFNRMAERLAEQKRQTERETENRLKLEKELRHSERLASVGRLAAGIAHELGAPLNVIDARADQLLAKPDAAPEKHSRNLTIIREQTERISKIIRQLLNLARPFDFRPTLIDLNELVGTSLEQYEENAANANVEIEFIPTPNLMISADRDYLAQVFVNIAQNAVQAMPAGGKLTVQTLRIENRAVVRFTDTGAGIAAENLENIFDPFFTTKDIGEGTGLGLAVSRRIIEEHGGNLVAANDPNGGANFTVLLPVNRES